MLDALIRVALKVAYQLLRVWWRIRRPEVYGAFVAVWHDERLLLIRNSYRKGETVPCGEIRSGESERDAAVRELFEEVGIRADPQALVFRGEVVVDFESKIDHAFFFDLRLEHEPHFEPDRREVASAEFVSAAELPSRPLTPHLRRYLEYAPARHDE